jgi:microcin C transport system substrate-binding protein
MNRQLFYGSYKRIKGYFGGGDFEALGSPGPDELALLEPLRQQVPPEVFGPVAYPPSTDPPNSLRQNLRQARDLLAQAGWTYRDGALRNAKGEAFVIEYLESSENGLRTLAPWVRGLEKLGIEFDFRRVDYAIYQERLRKFQFDMTGIRLPGTTSPGNEMWDLFGSKAAHTEDSNNLWGIESPAVDALINKLVTATTRAEAVAAGKALDRVLIHGWYSIPQWYSNRYRVAWNVSRFNLPAVMPSYFEAETWAMSTWWAK